MAEYNTIPFTNPDIEEFVGKFDGENYPIKSGETRYFPSFLSEHLAKHLIEKMFRSASGKYSKLKLSEFQESIKKEILGEEMKSKSPEKPQTIKDKVLTHESKIKEMLLQEEKQKKAQEIEAMKIIEDK